MRRKWSSVILWQRTETYHGPTQILEHGSVLAQTAERLRLSYENEEPLRLDAAFSRETFSFPISVALEHENDDWGFESEVRNCYGYAVL